jgi:hypothetical protein
MTKPNVRNRNRTSGLMFEYEEEEEEKKQNVSHGGEDEGQHHLRCDVMYLSV